MAWKCMQGSPPPPPLLHPSISQRDRFAYFSSSPSFLLSPSFIASFFNTSDWRRRRMIFSSISFAFFVSGNVGKVRRLCWKGQMIQQRVRKKYFRGARFEVPDPRRFDFFPSWVGDEGVCINNPGTLAPFNLGNTRSLRWSWPLNINTVSHKSPLTY